METHKGFDCAPATIDLGITADAQRREAQSSVKIRSALNFCQGAMYKMDRDRAFTHR
jgi:hypothetical protein